MLKRNQSTRAELNIGQVLTGLAISTVLLLAGIYGLSDIQKPKYTMDAVDGQTIYTCDGLFRDSGGPSSDYQNNEDLTATFCSDAGATISIRFNEFKLQNNKDFLYVYDGRDASAPLIGAYTKQELKQVTLTSTGTCMTFRFVSDGSSTDKGWKGDFDCGSALPDLDGDGVPDMEDLDVDNDGLTNTEEGEEEARDRNGDGILDFRDIDSDDDGLTDNLEAQSSQAFVALQHSDQDRDGLDDAYDSVVGAKGGGLTPFNTLGLGDPDYINVDTDGDGILDNVEGHDTNFDGVVDSEDSPVSDQGTYLATDADQDGLTDNFDNDDNAFDPSNGGLLPSDFPSNGGIPAFRTDANFPVEWLSFTAEAKGTTVLLEWSTAQEVNAHHYEVERAIDGVDFEKIGNLKAAGNSQVQQDYSFRDEKVSSRNFKRLYYRLKQVDIDGAFEYSSTVEVLDRVSPSMSQLHAFPNPATTKLNIRTGGEPSVTYRLLVLNLNGKPVLDRQVKGESLEIVEVDTWTPGIYLLQVKGRGYESQRKVLVK